MSKFVTLKTIKEHRFKKLVNLGGIKCQFDDFGMVDVPERQVETLLEAGLELVEAEEAEKYAKLREEIESRKEQNKPSVDVYDENQKLKVENAKLKGDNETLKKRIDELEGQLVKAMEGDLSPEDAEKYDSVKAAEIRELLKDQKLAEMKDFCDEQKLPKEEWDGFTKKDDIKEYLVKKLSKVE